MIGILPLRGTVLFPHAVVPLAAGRASSVQAIEEAARGSRLIGTVMQKDPPRMRRIGRASTTIGTLALIHKVLKQPDGSLRLVVQGLGRFRLGELVQSAPFLRARIESIAEDRAARRTSRPKRSRAARPRSSRRSWR